MNTNPETGRPMLTIDYHSNRIRIHKVTLELLGNPEYIELLINPGQQTIAVRPCSGTNDRAHRVNKNRKKFCMQIQSAYLFRSLRQVNEDFENGKTYRLTGRMSHSDDVAHFMLNNAIDITRMEVSRQ